MLKSVHSLKGLTIQATDGEIGKVVEFYFDDAHWTVRYLVVNTGGWLDERLVLISPMFVGDADWDSRRLHVRLTKQQVENSPDVDTQKPVSRQHEAEYLNYYGYPSYWGDSGLWGSAFSPSMLLAVPAFTPTSVPENEAADSHLRSTQAVTGSEIEATDGELGHVADFILDLDTWAIVYVEVSTRNWLPGKKVLISPQWINTVNWSDLTVKVNLGKETIKGAPEYIESEPITREYESALHDYYGVPPYWSQRGQAAP
jgi:uncharacterized protein YrrD